MRPFAWAGADVRLFLLLLFLFAVSSWLSFPAIAKPSLAQSCNEEESAESCTALVQDLVPAGTAAAKVRLILKKAGFRCEASEPGRPPFRFFFCKRAAVALHVTLSDDRLEEITVAPLRCRQFPACFYMSDCNFPYCEPSRCEPDEDHECVSTQLGHYTALIGVTYGARDGLGFELGVLPPHFPPQAAGGYSGFVLGMSDISRRRLYVEFVPSVVVSGYSWYWGAGVGHEPARGPLVQATLGLGFLALMPYVRVMAFPQAPSPLAAEVGISLKFAPLGDTASESYQERRPRKAEH